MKVEMPEKDWHIALTALAYAAGQYSRAGDVKNADLCRYTYNEVAKQTKLRTGLPLYNRSDKL